MPSRKPAARKKPAAKPTTKPTAKAHAERFAQNAAYVFQTRQEMPQELRDIANNWLVQMGAYANGKNIAPPTIACAIAALMAVVIQTHCDCAAVDGVPQDQSMEAMLHYFDLAARVEMGIIAFKHAQEPRH